MFVSFIFMFIFLLASVFLGLLLITGLSGEDSDKLDPGCITWGIIGIAILAAIMAADSQCS